MRVLSFIKWGEKLICKLADSITYLLSENKLIDHNEKDIYAIGFEVLIGTFINYFVILVVAYLLHDLMGAFWFIICFSSVRNFCGGYHARTRFKCLFIMVGAFYVVKKISDIIMGHCGIFLYAYIFITIFFAYILFTYAPVIDKTKRFRPNDVIKNRKKSVRVIFLWYLLHFVFINSTVSIKIGMTMNIIAIMILMTKPWINKKVGTIK